LIAVGIPLCFFGRGLLRVAICLAGLLTSIFVACFLFYAIYFQGLDDLTAFWYFLGGGVLVGIILGCILAHPKLIKVGSSILAGWGGYCVGLILVETIFAWT
jgi:hypothetical protein